MLSVKEIDQAIGECDEEIKRARIEIGWMTEEAANQCFKVKRLEHEKERLIESRKKRKKLDKKRLLKIDE